MYDVAPLPPRSVNALRPPAIVRQAQARPTTPARDVWVGRPAPAKPAEVAKVAEVAKLADVAWLAGRWSGVFNGARVETTWAPAQAGVMTCMMLIHAGDRPFMVQFGTLRETPEGLVFAFRNFDVEGRPLEPEPVTMKAVEVDREAGRVVFENPAHAMPKRTTMSRLGADGLKVRSELEPGGKPTIHELTLRRQP